MVSNNVFWSSDKSNQITANLYLADNKALFMMATSGLETYSNNVIFKKVKFWRELLLILKYISKN